MRYINLKHSRIAVRAIILSVLLGLVLYIQAQVTIGSGIPPDENALLDLKEDDNGNSTKGLLLPRVQLSDIDSPSPLTEHKEGMFVYNIGENGFVGRGVYYNTGEKWEKVSSLFTNWFYMPSVVFDTSLTGEGFTKNLYELYRDQFENPMMKSSDAPPSIPHMPAANDLYYYITVYDTDVFEIISLSDSGILVYNIKQAVSAYSLINIIFVLK
ncbi:hypothetical protein [Dysgonomonas termitidis]|jgi:hypothetical protein